MALTSCGNAGGCSGISSYGDLKTQWINAGNINNDQSNGFPPSNLELRSKTPWLIATSFYPGDVCAGVIKGISSYQLYKCMPTSNGGSQYYSLTLTNLGPTPGISIFVDQYSDNQCKVCLSCLKSIGAMAVIDAGMQNKCSNGVSFAILLVQNRSPNIEGVPNLISGYTTTQYYDRNSTCMASGVAPQMIRAMPNIDTTSYLPLQCTSSSPCASVSTPFFNGFSSSNLILQPALPVGTVLCPTYPDYNYLGFLSLLIIPLCMGVCWCNRGKCGASSPGAAGVGHK